MITKNILLSLLNFIKTNPVDSSVLAIIIIALIIYIYLNKKNILKKAALYAVTLAEQTWGSNTGQIKFAEVYTWLRQEYPIVTFFFTEKQLKNIIETALTRLKEILASKNSVENKEFTPPIIEEGEVPKEEVTTEETSEEVAE